MLLNKFGDLLLAKYRRDPRSDFSLKQGGLDQIFSNVVVVLPVNRDYATKRQTHIGLLRLHGSHKRF